MVTVPSEETEVQSSGVTLQPAAGNAASANHVGFEQGVGM